MPPFYEWEGSVYAIGKDNRNFRIPAFKKLRLRGVDTHSGKR